MSYNPNPYGPPSGSGYQQYPPPRQENEYYPQGYSSPPPQNYGGYPPPREEQYRHSPHSSGMQVGQYDPGYGHEPRNAGSYTAPPYRESQGGYYIPPQSQGSYNDRPSSRGPRQEGEWSGDRSRDHGQKQGHEAEKSIGAALLGGAVAGFAGHEFGHSNGIVTVASALAGAYAGHKLEAKHVKDKKKKKEQKHGGSAYAGRDAHGERRRSRSVSRKRSSSGRRRSKSSSSSSSSSDSDSSKRRRRRNH